MSRARPLVTHRPAAEQQQADLQPKARVPMSRITNARVSRLSGVRKSIPVQQQTIAPTQATKEFSFKPLNVGDASNVMDVAPYENFIYRTLRQREISTKKMTWIQQEITFQDRNLMINAIDRIHYKLGLTTNTFYRFMGIFDRYLSAEQVPKAKLELYACACLFIASKIDDMYPSLSSDIVSLTNHSFSTNELFVAEVQVSNAIDFDTTFGTALFFLTHFMRISNIVRHEECYHSRYLLEICQSHEHFFGMAPSKIAAVAIYTERLFMRQDPWPKTLADFTQYTEADLLQSVNCLRSILHQQVRPEASYMRRKYGSDLYLNVADIELPPSLL